MVRLTLLFTKVIGKDLFVSQIYVDDIIFGSTNPSFCEEFGEMMSREFEMSMIGEFEMSKFMLMILSLVQLSQAFVRNLVK